MTATLFDSDSGQYVFSNPDRFGDWTVIEAGSVEEATKLLKRRSPARHKRQTHVRLHVPTRVRREQALAAGLPFPVPPTSSRVRRGR